MEKKVFLICPVRGVSQEENEEIAAYVARLESDGAQVYWPHRDTDQNDPVGLTICQTNRKALLDSDEVHVWYNKTSQGSIFDFGMVFAAWKKTVIANPEAIQRQPFKCFENVLLGYADLWK